MDSFRLEVMGCSKDIHGCFYRLCCHSVFPQGNGKSGVEMVLFTGGSRFKPGVTAGCWGGGRGTKGQSGLEEGTGGEDEAGAAPGTE